MPIPLDLDPNPPNRDLFNPDPPNGSSEQSVSINKLTWNGVCPYTFFIIYFGTSNPPPLLDDEPWNQPPGEGGYCSATDCNYNLSSPLHYSTTYYWKIVEVSTWGYPGELEGPVWSFTTEDEPGTNTTTTPSPTPTTTPPRKTTTTTADSSTTTTSVRPVPTSTTSVRNTTSTVKPAPDTTTTTTKKCPLLKIYGEDSEEVDILRYIRDNVLAQTPAGKELIKLYYQWSPVVIKAMEEDEAFKEEVKEMIDGISLLIRREIE